MRYDGMRDPDPQAWLALPEAERVAAVEQGHTPLPRRHAPVPNLRLHAAIHTTVETQLAQNSPPEVRQTLARLVREGLTRHEAIHAIGSAVAEVMAQMMKEKKPYDAGQYARALAALRAEEFRGAADND